MIKKIIQPNVMTTGLGLVLFALGGTSIVAFWSVLDGQSSASLPNSRLIVALANSFSLVLLSWLYLRHWRMFTTPPTLVEPEPDALQATMQRLFNLSLDMLAIGNMDGYFTHLNPAWERTLGFTLEELKTQPSIQFVHPEDREITQAEMDKLRAGISVSSQFENRYRCQDGSYKWLSWTAVPFLEDGLIYAVARDISNKKQTEAALQGVNEKLEIAIAQNMTQLGQAYESLLTEIVERREVEIALRKSESLYRNLVETIPHGINEFDTTGFITFGNAAYYKMLGYAEGELLGKPIWDLMPEPERLAMPRYIAKQVQEQPPPTPYLGKMLTKDGKLLDIQVDWNYKRDEQGQVIGFIAVVTDITESQRMAEALRSSEERFRVALQNSPTVVFNQDRELRYTWVYNCQPKTVADQIIGKSDAELLAPEDAERLSAIKRRVLATGVGTREETFLTVNGEVRYYDLTVEPLRVQRGSPVPVEQSVSEAISDESASGSLRASLFTVSDSNSAAYTLRDAMLFDHASLSLRFSFGVRDTAPTQTLRTTLGASTGQTNLQGVEPPTEDVVGITCAATDITEIRVREQQLRAIFEQSLDAITIFDDEGTYIQANAAASPLFGLPPSQLLGRRIVEFMEPGFDFEQTWRFFRERGQLKGKIRLVRPDGTVREVEYAAKANFLPGQHLSILRDISDVYDELRLRKQAEVALRDSQHLLEKIADTIPSNLYIYDLRFATHIYANRRTEEFLGCTQAELQAMGPQFIAEFLHPEDIKQIPEFAKRFAVARDDEVLEHELRLKNAKGEWRWFRAWEVIFTRTADGKPKHILGAATDITERKQTEEALRASEKQLRTVLEAAHMGSWEWNIQTGKITWSGNFEQLLGISADGSDGNYQSFIRIIHPEDCDRVLQKVKRVFRTKENYKDEFRIILPDGNIRWLTRVGQIFYDETGRPVRMTGLDLDITDRKQVELALLNERNFISAILETANALIAVLDEQGRFVRFNRACEQITGYSFDEVQGKYIWDLLLIPEEIETVQTIIKGLQSGQFPNKNENYWVARDGSRHLISWFNTVILDADGSVKHIVSTGIDLTDRKRAEEMRRALEQEQALGELRLRFFAMASHEFRTPLSTILLTAQILESSAREWSEEKRKRNLQRIVSAAKEMRQMLDDILTINRAETGRLEFVSTQIDINTFCCQLLQEMQLYASPQHRLTFSNPTEVQWGFGDEKLLHYSLIHLLSNAIKYSPEGGEVNLTLSVTPDAIIFKIGDQGIGIIPSDEPHLFEAFYRGENVDCISGSGLGLTVAKKCVELQGGSITFTSDVGVGTTFTVIIPTSQR
jgi:PAS domain S-box-containing protein